MNYSSIIVFKRKELENFRKEERTIFIYPKSCHSEEESRICSVPFRGMLEILV
jgi:hypothetical protein